MRPITVVISSTPPTTAPAIGPAFPRLLESEEEDVGAGDSIDGPVAELEEKEGDCWIVGTNVGERLTKEDVKLEPESVGKSDDDKEELET